MSISIKAIKKTISNNPNKKVTINDFSKTTAGDLDYLFKKLEKEEEVVKSLSVCKTTINIETS